MRQRFIETLNLENNEIIFPENSQLFVAMGACLSAKEVKESILLSILIQQLNELKNLKITEEATHTLSPLFENEDQLQEFRQRHYKAVTKKRNLKKYTGDIYLGIDVGSTTSKVILIDNEGSILYSFYNSNEGNPLNLIMRIIKEVYSN